MLSLQKQANCGLRLQKQAPVTPGLRLQHSSLVRRHSFSRSCKALRFPEDNDDTVLSSFRALRSLTQRYDFLSSGVGALCVTSYFVMKGQDPRHALAITFAACILALVVNELLFCDQQR